MHNDNSMPFVNGFTTFAFNGMVMVNTFFGGVHSPKNQYSCIMAPKDATELSRVLLQSAYEAMWQNRGGKLEDRPPVEELLAELVRQVVAGLDKSYADRVAQDAEYAKQKTDALASEQAKADATAMGIKPVTPAS